MFTQFLGALNTCISAYGNDGFAGHRDWRLPTFAEPQSINYLSPGCPVSPCIDPTLLPVGPSLSLYWSSINADNTHAKALGFTPSGTCDCPKTVPNYVRAVRDTLGPPAFP
ncbi:MAG: DUF1566 domain-containing protein [Candidatus Binatia bacterium]